MDIADRLKLIRTEKNMSLESFASMLETSRQVLSNYEAKKRFPVYSLLVKIVEVFSISPEWLLLGEGEMYRQPEPTNKPLKNEDKQQNFKEWGSRLCTVLANNSITPHRFSNMSGIREGRINKFILDSVEPTIKELNAIAMNLDISIDWLLYGEKIKNTPAKSSDELTSTEVLELKSLLKNLKK